MTAPRPPFDELVGGDLDAAERERLLAVHELLVRAGPPPELTGAAARLAPPRSARRRPFQERLPVRLRLAAVGAAAAAALALFGGGYLVGSSRPGDATVRTVELRGQAGARATLTVLPRDGAGNWHMRLAVWGLPPLAQASYELWLTKGGRLAELCGSFAVAAAGRTQVHLSTPYPLRDYDAWVVVRAGTTRPVLSSA